MTPEPAGSLAEEATKLVEALQGWLSTGPHSRPDPWAEATADNGAGEVAPECAVCPFCRSMRFVRTLDPEVIDRVIDAGAALVASLQDLRRTAGST